MKKILSLIIMVLLVPTLVFANETDKKVFTYSQLGYERLTGIVSNDDGTYVVVGQYTDGEDNDSAIIVKYDKDDKVLWKQNIGTKINIYGVEVTSDGGYVATGTIYGNSSLDSNAGIFDGLLVKYDKDGKYLWHTIVSRQDLSELYDLEIASDGTIYAVGYTSMGGESTAPINGGTQAIVVKFDKDGKILKELVFDPDWNESFNSISFTDDGGYITSGYTNSTNIEGITNDKDKLPIIVKYDKEDKVEWISHIPADDSIDNNAGCYLDDYVYSEFYEAIQTKDGGYVAVGNVKEHIYGQYPGFSSEGYIEMYYAVIAKFDKDGKQVWVKKYESENVSIFTDVEEDKDGKLYVTGHEGQIKQVAPIAECTSSIWVRDALLIIYDKDGNVLEEDKYDGSEDERLIDAELPEDGGYIVVGELDSDDLPETKPNEYEDGLIIKVIPVIEEDDEIIPDKKEEVENPKTGVEDYIIYAVIVFALGGFVFNLVNKNQVFKKM